MFAMTQVNNSYKDEQTTFNEFKNIYDNAQDQSFQKVTSTPNYQDMKEGQIFIYVSTPASALADVRIMLRVGTTIYASPQFPIIKVR